jgi:hypothetical protein
MMSRRLIVCFIFFFSFSVLYGQNSTNSVLLVQLDGAVKNLAADIQKKIPAGGSPKIALGRWIYQDSVPALGRYWAAQLTGELANIPDRSFVLIEGPGASDWTVSGEIIEAPGIIRVYTRLFRSGEFSIAAGFHADFDRHEGFAEMLSSGGSSHFVAIDPYETDSMENPLAADLNGGEDGAGISRTIHAETDEDFFLLAPDKDGLLIMETAGNMDTYMELYDAGSREKLAENDDDGGGTNARIRQELRSGNRYIAKVRGYGGDTGIYGFHAWLTEAFGMAPDEYEDDNTFDSAKELSPGTPQRHTFTTGDDEDWVFFRISRAGRCTIRARGLNTTALDTSIELYDSSHDLIDSDDDGGANYDSRLSVRLQAGTYYVKVKCLDDEPDEPYTISVDGEQGDLEGEPKTKNEEI